MKSVFSLILALSAHLIIVLPAAAEYAEKGIIESKGKDQTVTILFRDEPREGSYLVMDGKTIYGNAVILSTWDYGKGGYACKSIARVELFRKESKRFLRPGMKVAIDEPARKKERQFSPIEIGKERSYRQKAQGTTDGREMVLVPEGKFVLGNNRGSRDEYPEQVMHLKAFYIDRFEVSNRDYKEFMKSSRTAPPQSWKNGAYDEKQADLPVMVTYYEASRYARWAGKRLPTEFEWEKAARGSERVDGDALTYPWGHKYDRSKTNSEEFWSGEDDSELKSTSRGGNKGLLPVRSFESKGDSPYGVVNMTGNAPEWTSSWYGAYRGNKKTDARYGRQYRVIRGGAWFNNEKDLRVTRRALGGLPNLERDNRAGFRCVKDVSVIDHEK